MKRLYILFALILTAISAIGQQVIGPATGFAFVTNTAVFFIPGETTTNISTNLVRNMSVGAGGAGFFLRVGATNAASTTNATITMEATIDGNNWFTSPTTALPVLSVPQNGTTGANYYTNIQATSANFGNIRWVRVKSIQNTNVLGIFITNFTWSAR